MIVAVWLVAAWSIAMGAAPSKAGQSADDAITLTGPATVSYAENGAVRVATYVASSEADLSSVAWTLSGNDAGHFSIDNPAGVLRFDFAPVRPNRFAAAPDFEAPGDLNGDNAYEVTVTVSSGTTMQSLNVTVTVEDQDEAGTLTLSTTRPRLGSELTATASDPDDVDGTPVYTWERSAGRNVWTAIAGATTGSYTPAAGTRTGSCE